MQAITIRVRPMRCANDWTNAGVSRRISPSVDPMIPGPSTPFLATMLMVRRSKRASTVGHNNGNRIPSLNSWNGCSRTDISDADRAG
jgi:hypothetical protein